MGSTSGKEGFDNVVGELTTTTVVTDYKYSDMVRLLVTTRRTRVGVRTLTW